MGAESVGRTHGTELSQLDDGKLLELAQAGSHGALNVLFSRYRRLVLAKLIKTHGIPSDQAEDVLQAVYRRFMSYLPRVTQARGFLLLAAGSLARNAHQARRRERSAMERYGQAVAPPPPTRVHEERAIQRLDLDRALGSLEPEAREFVRAILIERVPYREYAERTGMPVGSIGPVLGKHLAFLRRNLDGYGGGES